MLRIQNLLLPLILGTALAATPAPTHAQEAITQQQVDAACQRAAKWLISQQYQSGCIQDLRGRGKQNARHKRGEPPRHGVAMSALAVMGLAAIGHLPTDPTDEGKAMRAALDFVLLDEHQESREAYHGYYGASDNSRMYGHGIITLMLAEMLGMGVNEEMDKAIRGKCQDAIDLILRAQKRRGRSGRNRGGWRYTPGDSDADLSVTVWQLMALRAARNAGLEVPRKAIDDAVGYVKRTFSERGHPEDGKSAFGYEVGHGPTFSTAAEGLLSMQVCGRYEDKEVIAASHYLLRNEPKPHERWFYYGIYYYAQGMAQRGGEFASTAKQAAARVLLKAQERDGSWRAHNGDEANNGRVYTTAMALLSLSVHHNFLPIYQR